MNIDKEEWRDIKGYEGHYQISNLGRVKSLYFKNRQGKIFREKILKQNFDNMGYLFVGLSNNGTLKTTKIHRLVAETFIDNPNNYKTINHINGVKTDNRVENLEWCTQKYNVQQAYKNGLGKGKKEWDSPLSKKVNQYTLDGEFIKTWACTKQIERELGFKNSNISACCNGRLVKAYNFIWRYVDE